jgi:hypothetical protein
LLTVREFQRSEVEPQDRVRVIVTLRTVVADRLRVPYGTPVVKLEEFDDQRIATWLAAWNEANAEGIARGRTGLLDFRTAIAQRSLAAQPLMLVMLAVYAADPHAPALDGASKTVLYERFLRQFATRETAKTTPGLPQQDLDMLIERELRGLSIAALGMFARGRLDISAEELGADLAAWQVFRENPIEAARQVVMKFFFVHASASRGGHAEQPEPSGHRYEFLHTTFGDYLVARLITEELRYAAESRFSLFPQLREQDPGILFPLLAHRVLSTRQPILEFVKDAMTTQLTADERHRVTEVLTGLLGRHRYRPDKVTPRLYQPIATDHVEQLATHSANLVLLRLVADREPLALSAVFDPDRRPDQSWRSLLGLWQAGLDQETMDSLRSTIRYEDGCLVRTTDDASERPDSAPD